MNNKALVNSFVWPGLPFCARLTLNEGLNGVNR